MVAYSGYLVTLYETSESYCLWPSVSECFHTEYRTSEDDTKLKCLMYIAFLFIAMLKIFKINAEQYNMIKAFA